MPAWRQGERPRGRPWPRPAGVAGPQQQLSAATRRFARRPTGDRARPLVALRGLLSSRMWVAGLALGLSGWSLHVAALSLAPLSLVQAFAAGGLALAAPLGARALRQPLGARERRAIVMIVLALALLAAGAVGGAPAAAPAAGPAALFMVPCAALAALLAAVAGRAAPTRWARPAGVVRHRRRGDQGADCGGPWRFGRRRRHRLARHPGGCGRGRLRLLPAWPATRSCRARPGAHDRGHERGGDRRGPRPVRRPAGAGPGSCSWTRWPLCSPAGRRGGWRRRRRASSTNDDVRVRFGASAARAPARPTPA